MARGPSKRIIVTTGYRVARATASKSKATGWVRDGRTIALRLWKRQLRTLARGTSGLVEALEEEQP